MAEQGYPGSFHIIGSDKGAPLWPDENIGPLEVALRGGPVPGQGSLSIGATNLPDFLLGPDVELPLNPLRVGVLGRVEATGGMSEIPPDVVDCLGGDLEPPVVVRDLPCVEVDPGQESVVIEHLLKVGDQPAVVDRVAGESPAQVVVDPARGHGVEGRGDHLEGCRVARR